jgi:zona occludens toxin
MALSAYTGLPGSGKSYGVVKHVIIPALTQGREVWTNIPLNNNELVESGLSDNLPIAFEIKDIQDNPDWFQTILPKGVLFILDECQLLWPSGLKQTTANALHLEFLTKHRHMVGEDKKSTEIILLTQRLTLIANFCRGLVEKTLVTTNLAVIGRPKSYRIDIYAGAANDKPSKANVLRSTVGNYEPETYKFYQSHTESEYGAGDEKRMDDRISIFGSWKFKGMLVLFVLMIGMVVFLTNKFMTESGFFESSGETSDLIDNSTALEMSASVARQPVVSTAARLKEIKLLEQIRQSNIESEKPHFFKDLSDYYISYNNGIFPNIDYMIKVSSKGSTTTLSSNELTLMGYSLKKINQCLVIVQYKGFFELPVMCRESNKNRQSQGLISSAVANNPL